jgi:hypothetical protein
MFRTLTLGRRSGGPQWQRLKPDLKDTPSLKSVLASVIKILGIVNTNNVKHECICAGLNLLHWDEYPRIVLTFYP